MSVGWSLFLRQEIEMSTYKQLTYEQRCQIEALKKSGLTQQGIANQLGVSQATISRELARNSGDRGYRHRQAQQKATERRCSVHKPHKMTDELIDKINHYLYQEWSPEQISGWFLANEEIDVSHESIYRHIWRDKKAGGDLYCYLRRRCRPYQSRSRSGKTTRGQIKNRISIDDRPAEVDLKEEVGHWEVDTMIGAAHSGALVTIVERKTQLTLSKQVNKKSADAVAKAVIKLLTPFMRVVKSITSDNGKEFARHEEISEKLGCQFYFANPYHSWERGLNENTNGLLRQYFPKKTNFKLVTQNEVKQAVNKLNHRPRKTLAFKTPADLMAFELAAIAA